MITVSGVEYTLSEVIQLVKSNPNTIWRTAYYYYLIQIDRSSTTNFCCYGDFIMKLLHYVMREPPLHELAHYRGNGPTLNSAMCLSPINRDKVNQQDVAAINHFMNTSDMGRGISYGMPHNTDPETGLQKSENISVTEYYVNGAAGRRVTKRTELHKITYYYSDKYSFNSYKYARLT